MGSDIPTYLTTHPGIEDRVNTMSTRVSSMPAELRNRKDNNTRFKRIQTLIRAKYSDVDVANIYFINELKSGDNALVRMGQGILWARQNKVQDATKAFDAALSLAPTEQLIMREAGMFHYTKGNKEKGISLLKKSLELKPKDTMALFYLSQVLADQGNYTQAIEYTRNILRTVPEDVEVHDMLGRYYGQNNQLFKAYLHLSYAALYANNKQKVKQLAEKTKGYAKTAAEKADMKRFDDTYKERKDFW